MQSMHRQKIYKKTNGCSKQFQCQQIFWAFSIITLITLYCIFTVPPIVKAKSVAMIIFMAIIFLLCVIMIIDYFILTITDPVDPRISGQMVEGITKFCSKCLKDVGVKTYHCMKCERCTDQLDHHSQLVNNCISMNNMSNYLRMNACFSLLLAGISIESFVLFATTLQDTSEFADYITNKWVILLVAVCSIVSFLIAVFNLAYSSYIRFYRKMAKIEYLYRETGSNNSEIETSQKIDSSKSNGSAPEEK